MEDSKLTVIADEGYRCAEAPIWEPSRARMIWADIEAAAVYQYMPSTRARSVLSERLPVSGIALHKGGYLVFAGDKGMYLWRGVGDAQALVTGDHGEPLSFNDILADARGRIYAGTIDWGPQGMHKPGKLYLIEPGPRARVVDEGIELANGLAFSPDDKTLYLADSAARKIYAYDCDPRTGSLSRKRVFVHLHPSEGIPDGLTADSAGCLWCALWYGGQVVRYDPEGKVERRIDVPARQVSSLAFGGDELRDLYITTAGQHWESPLMPPGYDPAAAPIGGAVYRARLYVQGRLEHQANLV